MKIDLVILAAGYARRFQGNKLLHVWQGKPILAHVMDTCQQVDFHAIHVVSQYEEVLALAHTRGMHAVKNDHPQKGMSSSLQLSVLRFMELFAIPCCFQAAGFQNLIA